MPADEESADAPAVKGRYLYAIVEGTPGPYDFNGMDDGPVYAVGDGEVAAVVSDLPSQKLRPERRRLFVHHDVLKRLMDRHAVLPMVFGLIADSPEAVHRLLLTNGDAFREQFARVRGKVEMGLHVTWDVPNIFEFILTLHPDLQAARDHMFRGSREPLYQEKIELGRQFEQALAREREHHTDSINEALTPYCAEIIAAKPRNEKEIANLACLVAREQLKEFEKAVVDVAKRYDTHYAFDFNGPWPPHNFATLELQW